MWTAECNSQLGFTGGGGKDAWPRGKWGKHVHGFWIFRLLMTNRFAHEGWAIKRPLDYFVHVEMRGAMFSVS